MSILGLNEAANPLLTILPIVLMLSSGYAVGKIISKVRINSISVRLRDFIYGSIVLNFLFLSGFIIFGVLTHLANGYFTAFTYLLVGLTAVAAYFLVKKIIAIVTTVKISFKPKDWRFNFERYTSSLIAAEKGNNFILFGIVLVVSLLIYQAIIIYYHPIYSEYDSIYRFLPISKSILLGNGLNHDFYLGSDANMRHPPYIQVINAWLIHSFEYSSIRAFPFYYVLVAAIAVYSLARNILNSTSEKKNVTFLSLIASSIFLITPAILVVSSRFSLQQDIGFIFILTASFYFLSDIIRYDKPAKTSLVMLTASLALMALTREVGLVLAVAFFFILPAIKFTEGNPKIRVVFTILSLFPFYLLSFKDLSESGLTFVTTTRIAIILLFNLAIYYLTSLQKNQNKFSSLFTPKSNLKYVTPIIIPIIFIVINLTMIGGPYPIFTFTGDFSKLLPAYREILSISNPLALNIYQTLTNLPRIDILFISLAMGSIFIFFKLIGLGKLIYYLKGNSQYSLVLILLIFLLCTWSILLQSRFQTSDIRYVTYFIPLLSVIVVLGINIRKSPSMVTKIFCSIFMVIATYCILHFSLFTWNYYGHFGGFWIDPNLRSFTNFEDIRVAAVLTAALIILELSKDKLSLLISKYRLEKYASVVLIALICIQAYNLNTSGIQLASPEKLDEKPPRGWESNVFEVVNYLNNSEKGNVFSIRAPAISFFTNRTNFDIFSPQTFAYTASLFLSANTTSLKERIQDLGIRYIVVPNAANPQYYLVKNSTLGLQLLPSLSNNLTFSKIPLKDYDVYVYAPSLMNESIR